MQLVPQGGASETWRGVHAAASTPLQLRLASKLASLRILSPFRGEGENERPRRLALAKAGSDPAGLFDSAVRRERQFYQLHDPVGLGQDFDDLLIVADVIP